MNIFYSRIQTITTFYTVQFRLKETWGGEPLLPPLSTTTNHLRFLTDFLLWHHSALETDVIRIRIRSGESRVNYKSTTCGLIKHQLLFSLVAQNRHKKKPAKEKLHWQYTRNFGWQNCFFFYVSFQIQLTCGRFLPDIRYTDETLF